MQASKLYRNYGVWLGAMLAGVMALSCASAPAVTTITVDTSRNAHAISPDIYGISVSGGARPYFKDMGVSVVRWGGNARSRFNWEINSSNAGADWEYRNVSKGDTMPGSAAIEFHNMNRSAGAKSLIALPIIGWVANDRSENTRSIDVPEGILNGYDPEANRIRTSFVSYARKGGEFEYPPNLEDTAVFQDEWIYYLTQTIGNAQSRGITFYEMGNEPMLWAETHRDIRPFPAGYDEYAGIFLSYANAVKDVDPAAQVLGPASWGWMSYFYSAVDEGDDNYSSAPDRKSHNNEPFLPWLLQQIRESDDAIGRRSLDTLSIHYYPQGGEFSDDVSEDMQELRLRSTRSLWDESYKDESWISRTDDGPVVRLIPRMHEWIDANYPGTKLAITEWNWGAADHISGGLATADVLGIFGRDGVDLATYWGDPGEGSPTYWAFRMFRNYDGRGSSFGDVSVNSTSDQPNIVTAYASTSTNTNEITIVLINKSPSTARDVRVELNGAAPDSNVLVYRYGAENLNEIAQMSLVKMAGNELTHTLPPYSITMLVAQSNANESIEGQI